MEDVAAVMKSLVTNAVTPIVSRLEALEKRLADLPVPKDGKDGEPGASVTLEDVAPMIKAECERLSEELLQSTNLTVAEIIASVPTPAPGKDADPEIIKQMVAEAVAAIPPAEKGKDADPVEVAALVTQEAERILAGWERPKDGKDGAPGEKGADGAPGVNGIDGKDGRNGLDAVKFFRDDKGHLIVVKSDGSTDDLGEYVGRDGAAGERGKDGLDGVGFDDMSLVFDEEGIMIKFAKGENVKQERLPVPFYRGVFKEGQTYHAGNCVSYGGSTWIAHVETSDKPDGTTKTWQLSTKRGRDGRDGIMKDPPKGGPVKVG